ncbi:hypothetical protein R6Q59_036189 [Mikania micrantha]|uniref:Uncharacterized protein n=1 Tax=Mikania micrantha TaxID=192012 RepID=A0A5N6LA58_9ASTR|nr:hypothetical protein E3N88_45112 [Mikania micrantha]
MADGRSEYTKSETGKEEIKAKIHSESSPNHDKETHGTSDDIDKDTPIEKVKGPGVLERAKEEVEALVEAVHPKK